MVFLSARKTRYEGKRHPAKEMGLEKKTKAELSRIASEKRAVKEASAKAKADLKQKKSQTISQALQSVAELIDKRQATLAETLSTGDNEALSQARRRVRKKPVPVIGTSAPVLLDRFSC